MAITARTVVSRNTPCQPNRSTTKPPTTGPPTAPAPTALSWRPSALPRSLSSNIERSIAVDVACVMEAPSPIITRDPIRVATLPAKAHSNADTRKIAKPAM